MSYTPSAGTYGKENALVLPAARKKVKAPKPAEPESVSKALAKKLAKIQDEKARKLQRIETLQKLQQYAFDDTKRVLLQKSGRLGHTPSLKEKLAQAYEAKRSGLDVDEEVRDRLETMVAEDPTQPIHTVLSSSASSLVSLALDVQHSGIKSMLSSGGVVGYNNEQIKAIAEQMGAASTLGVEQRKKDKKKLRRLKRKMYAQQLKELEQEEAEADASEAEQEEEEGEADKALPSPATSLLALPSSLTAAQRTAVTAALRASSSAAAAATVLAGARSSITGVFKPTENPSELLYEPEVWTNNNKEAAKKQKVVTQLFDTNLWLSSSDASDNDDESKAGTAVIQPAKVGSSQDTKRVKLDGQSATSQHQDAQDTQDDDLAALKPATKHADAIGVEAMYPVVKIVNVERAPIPKYAPTIVRTSEAARKAASVPTAVKFTDVTPANSYAVAKKVEVPTSGKEDTQDPASESADVTLGKRKTLLSSRTSTTSNPYAVNFEVVSAKPFVEMAAAAAVRRTLPEAEKRKLDRRRRLTEEELRRYGGVLPSDSEGEEEDSHVSPEPTPVPSSSAAQPARKERKVLFSVYQGSNNSATSGSNVASSKESAQKDKEEPPKSASQKQNDQAPTKDGKLEGMARELEVTHQSQQVKQTTATKESKTEPAKSAQPGSKGKKALTSAHANEASAEDDAGLTPALKEVVRPFGQGPIDGSKLTFQELLELAKEDMQGLYEEALEEALDEAGITEEDVDAYIRELNEDYEEDEDEDVEREEDIESLQGYEGSLEDENLSHLEQEDDSELDDEVTRLEEIKREAARKAEEAARAAEAAAAAAKAAAEAAVALAAAKKAKKSKEQPSKSETRTQETPKKPSKLSSKAPVTSNDEMTVKPATESTSGKTPASDEKKVKQGPVVFKSILHPPPVDPPKPRVTAPPRANPFHVPVKRKPEIEAGRVQLPVYAQEQEIMEMVFENDVMILSGETGSGKTTQVPQFLYEAGFARDGSIVVTQPRRVAAISSANRIGEELNAGESTVAYQVRYDSMVRSETKIKVLTEGILLKEIQTDFLLSNYSVVIVDEAHERGLNTDILLGLLSRIVKLRAELCAERDKILEQNPKAPLASPYDRLPPKDSVSKGHLKLIIMSATLRVTDFTMNPRLFPIPPPVLNVASRQYPVTLHFSRVTPHDYFNKALQKVARLHRKLPPGGVLVFLTGRQEIEQFCKKLRKLFPEPPCDKSGIPLPDPSQTKSQEEKGGSSTLPEDKKSSLLKWRRKATIMYTDEAAEAEEEQERLERERVARAGEETEETSAEDAMTDKPTGDAAENKELTPEELEALEKKRQEEEEALYELSDDDDYIEESGVSDVSDEEDGEEADGEKKSKDRKDGDEDATAMEREGKMTNSVSGSKWEREAAQLEMDRNAAKPLIVLPLYAMLPTEQQMRIFNPKLHNSGVRIVVVSTNVAETSVTIPGIRYVIDCGREKSKVYDEHTGSSTFAINFISQASANQRAGRAGRVGAGHCYRLYSSAVYNEHFPVHTDPEILRQPIDATILQMKSMGIRDVAGFPYPTPPPTRTLQLACHTLYILGALKPIPMHKRRLLPQNSVSSDSENDAMKDDSQFLVHGREFHDTTSLEITDLGRGMSLFPVQPRFAKMLLAAANQPGCLPLATAIVAAMTVTELFVKPEVLRMMEHEFEDSAVTEMQEEEQENAESEAEKEKDDDNPRNTAAWKAELKALRAKKEQELREKKRAEYAALREKWQEARARWTVPHSDHLTFLRVIGGYLHLRASLTEKLWTKLDKMAATNLDAVKALYGNTKGLAMGLAWAKQPLHERPWFARTTRPLEWLPHKAQKLVADKLIEFCKDNFVRLKAIQEAVKLIEQLLRIVLAKVESSQGGSVLSTDVFEDLAAESEVAAEEAEKTNIPAADDEDYEDSSTYGSGSVHSKPQATAPSPAAKPKKKGLIVDIPTNRTAQQGVQTPQKSEYELRLERQRAYLREDASKIELPVPTPEQEVALTQIVLSGLCDKVARRMDDVTKANLIKNYKPGMFEMVPYNVLKAEREKRKLEAAGKQYSETAETEPMLTMRDLEGAYEVINTKEPVFLHPDSVVAKQVPEFVVFTEMTRQCGRRKRTLISSLTVIKPEWLPKLAAPLCSFSAPLEDPMPIYDEHLDQLVAFVKAAYGPHCWEIPNTTTPIPNVTSSQPSITSSDSTALIQAQPSEEPDQSVPSRGRKPPMYYRHLARLFLEGVLVPRLKAFRPYLTGRPSSVVSTTTTTHQIMQLVTQFDINSIVGRKELLEIWHEEYNRKQSPEPGIRPRRFNPDFLKTEYLTWVNPAKRKEAASAWPPL